MRKWFWWPEHWDEAITRAHLQHSEVGASLSTRAAPSTGIARQVPPNTRVLNLSNIALFGDCCEESRG